MNTSDAIGPDCRKHILDNRIPPPLVVVLIAMAMVLVAWLTPTLRIPLIGRSVFGSAITVLGLGVVVQGARTFWRHQTTINPVEIEQASRLVKTGVFQYSRNPMYIGFTCVLVGWATCLAALWTLIGPLAFVLFTNRFQIVPEERVMLAKFGKEYGDYRTKVRRWL